LTAQTAAGTHDLQNNGRPIAPLYPVVSGLELAGVVWLYRAAISAQGQWLQRRETRILECVAAATE
jgi:hypothetical protein